MPLPSRRGSMLPPQLETGAVGDLHTVPHIHPLLRQNPKMPRRTGGEPAVSGRRRRLHTAQDAQREPPLSAPRRRSQYAASSFAEITGQWQHTLRSRHCALPPLANGSGSPSRHRSSAITRAEPTDEDETVAAQLAAAALFPKLPKSSAVSATDVATTTVARARRSRTSIHAEQTLAEAYRRAEAAATLHQLLVPLWQLFRRRQRQRAVTVARHYFTLAALRRRERKRRESVDAIVACLRRGTPLALPQAIARLRAEVIGIQRAVRRHQARLEAGVELNLRKLRRDVEPSYWASVVSTREEQLLDEESRAPVKPLTVYGRIIAQQSAAEGKDAQRALTRPVNVGNSASLRPSYELDVYNYYMAGPMPELLLRLEIRRALQAILRRAAAQSLYIDLVWQCDDSPATSPIAGRRRRSGGARAHVPVFLPVDTCSAVMDNVCFVTSQLRSDEKLRAHLLTKEPLISSY